MTELQMGLIGLGVAAVAAVLGYNKWQEYRHRKLAESVLKPDHDDVLLDAAQRHQSVGVPSEPHVPTADGAVLEAPAVAMPATVEDRREPVFVDPAPEWSEPGRSAPDSAGEVPAAPETVPPMRAEPGGVSLAEPFEPVLREPLVPPMPAATPETPVAPSVPPAPAMPPRAPRSETTVVSAAPVEPASAASAVASEPPAELLDPRLEFVVAMEMVESVPARQILQSQRETLGRLHKPVHWVGFNERTREWEKLTADSEQPISRLRIGLQLVNRLGPVNGNDLAIFTGAMQGLADELMAVADMPPSRVLDQAAEIDRFCAAVDLEIGLNLVSRATAFPGTKIRALAEAAGMVLGADGLFTRHDDAGRPQFSLQNYESTRFSAEGLRTLSTHGLTFLLDVPRVDHGERVFQQMTELARRFADALQGTLVDDNRQPLNEAQLDHIRREFIGKPQATMLSYGIPAGSPQALRLFS